MDNKRPLDCSALHCAYTAKFIVGPLKKPLCEFHKNKWLRDLPPWRRPKAEQEITAIPSVTV